MAERSQIQDLASALEIFKSSTDDFAKSQAINAANQQIAQIRQSADSESKKREQFQSLANDLVLRLAETGAPATTIEQVTQAVAPEKFTTGQQMLVSGISKDNKELEQKGLKAIEEEATGRLKIEEAKAQTMVKREELRSENRMKETEAKAKLRPASEGLKKELRGLDAHMILGQDLYNKAFNDPELTSLMNRGLAKDAQALFNKKFATFSADADRWVVDFIHSKTGSAATDAERAQLKATLPKVGDPPEIFKAKMESVLRLADMIRTRYIENEEKLGKMDLSEIKNSSPLKLGSLKSPEGNALIPVRIKYQGKEITAYKDPKTQVVRLKP